MSKVQATTYEMDKRFSETVLHELDRRYSRETVTIAANAGPIPFGAVLADNGDGTFGLLKETAGAGEGATATLGTVGGVYIGPDLENATTRQQALVVRGYCIVNATNLVFDSSVTQKDAALAALRDLGIIVKEVPSDANA